MLRIAALLVLIALPASAGMVTREPLPGVTITRGPGTDPEPAWRAARREAYILRAANSEPAIVPIIIRDRPQIWAW